MEVTGNKTMEVTGNKTMEVTGNNRAMEVTGNNKTSTNRIFLIVGVVGGFLVVLTAMFVLAVIHRRKRSQNDLRYDFISNNFSKIPHVSEFYQGPSKSVNFPQICEEPWRTTILLGFLPGIFSGRQSLLFCKCLLLRQFFYCIWTKFQGEVSEGDKLPQGPLYCEKTIVFCF